MGSLSPRCPPANKTGGVAQLQLHQSRSRALDVRYQSGILHLPASFNRAQQKNRDGPCRCAPAPSSALSREIHFFCWSSLVNKRENFSARKRRPGISRAVRPSGLSTQANLLPSSIKHSAIDAPLKVESNAQSYVGFGCYLSNLANFVTKPDHKLITTAVTTEPTTAAHYTTPHLALRITPAPS